MDPGISLDWITPDRAISAFVGALAAAVALLIDQCRRYDESKNRFSDERLEAYERLISRLEVIGEFQLLRAEFAVLFRKIDNGEDLDTEDAKAQEALNERCNAILEKCDRHAGQGPTPRELLITSPAASEAANRLLKVITKMEAHADAGRYEKVTKLALRYEMASAGLT